MDWILSNSVVLFLVPTIVGLVIVLLIAIAFGVAIKNYKTEKNVTPLLGVVMPSEEKKGEK